MHSVFEEEKKEESLLVSPSIRGLNQRFAELLELTPNKGQDQLDAAGKCNDTAHVHMSQGHYDKVIKFYNKGLQINLNP